MQRILLLDNFDSFTFNLAHYLIGLEVEVDVVRSDVYEGNANKYDKVIFSPGPGLPNDSPIMQCIIEEVKGSRPILGVCLGMQSIGIHLGGELYNQATVKHGVTEKITLENSFLFTGISRQIQVGLYHSWALKKTVGNFRQTAFSENDVLMAIENIEQELYGVQFHPESIMTPNGKQILQNFLLLE